MNRARRALASYRRSSRDVRDSVDAALGRETTQHPGGCDVHLDDLARPGQRNVRTQIEQIGEIAAELREHWVDFLGGDPTSFHQRHTAWTEYWRSRRPTPEQLAMKPFNVACTQAGHAFKRGEFASVVLLLTPYSAVLGKKQRKMLETSLERAGSNSD